MECGWQFSNLITRSLTQRAHAEHLTYGMPKRVYLIARSLTQRAHAKHLTCGMPEWDKFYITTFSNQIPLFFIPLQIFSDIFTRVGNR